MRQTTPTTTTGGSTGRKNRVFRISRPRNTWWNSSAASLVIQNPPGAANWSIGTSGAELTSPMKIKGVRPRDAGPDLPKGFIESPNHPVQPASLYRAQLAERLGPAALKALEP